MKQAISCRRLAIEEAVDERDAIFGHLPADYADAYSFSAGRPLLVTAEALQRGLWSRQPKLAAGLMRLRNILVKPLGLKTSDEQPIDPWLAQAERVRRRDEAGRLIDEVVIHSDDRHLAFWVSLKVAGDRVTVVTVVRWHNALGRVYFAVIKPWHGPLLCSTIKHVLRQTLNEAGGQS